MNFFFFFGGGGGFVWVYLIRVKQYLFVEIGRLLRVGRRYMCVSLAQEHILKKMVDYFPKQ